MNNTKQTIIHLLRDTIQTADRRKGMHDLVEYLERGTDFFEAPASTKHHCAYVGGLAEHSLNVHGVLVQLVETFGTRIPYDSIAITALLHDVSKTEFYVPEKAWRKDDHGKWESYTRWGINDSLPLGHSQKSLSIINRFISLTDEESAAIMWHMGAWTPGVISDYATSRAFNDAVARYPLVTLLSTADLLASRLIEQEP